MRSSRSRVTASIACGLIASPASQIRRIVEVDVRVNFDRRAREGRIGCHHCLQPRDRRLHRRGVGLPVDNDHGRQVLPEAELLLKHDVGVLGHQAVGERVDADLALLEIDDRARGGEQQSGREHQTDDGPAHDRLGSIQSQKPCSCSPGCLVVRRWMNGMRRALTLSPIRLSKAGSSVMEVSTAARTTRSAADADRPVAGVRHEQESDQGQCDGPPLKRTVRPAVAPVAAMASTFASPFARSSR